MGASLCALVTIPSSDLHQHEGRKTHRSGNALPVWSLHWMGHPRFSFVVSGRLLRALFLFSGFKSPFKFRDRDKKRDRTISTVSLPNTVICRLHNASPQAHYSIIVWRNNLTCTQHRVLVAQVQQDFLEDASTLVQYWSDASQPQQNLDATKAMQNLADFTSFLISQVLFEQTSKRANESTF